MQAEKTDRTPSIDKLRASGQMTAEDEAHLAELEAFAHERANEKGREVMGLKPSNPVA